MFRERYIFTIFLSFFPTPLSASWVRASKSVFWNTISAGDASSTSLPSGGSMAGSTPVEESRSSSFFSFSSFSAFFSSSAGFEGALLLQSMAATRANSPSGSYSKVSGAMFSAVEFERKVCRYLTIVFTYSNAMIPRSSSTADALVRGNYFVMS